MRHRQIIDERLASHAALAEERWQTHTASHAALAAALVEYKAQSNEWRATLSDVRSVTLSRSEYAAEHKLLRTELLAIIERNELRIGALERAVQQGTDRDKTTREILNGARNLIIVGFTIMGGMLGLVVYLERSLG